jgi:hypothetical protein
MNRVNDTTQNVEVNKGEIKKLRTIKLSMDVNDYDTGEYTYSKVFAVKGVPPAAD